MALSEDKWSAIESAPEDELVLVWGEDVGTFALYKDPEPKIPDKKWVSQDGKTLYSENNFSLWAELPTPNISRMREIEQSKNANELYCTSRKLGVFIKVHLTARVIDGPGKNKKES